MDIRRPNRSHRVGGRRRDEVVTVIDDDVRRRTLLIDVATAIEVFGDPRLRRNLRDGHH